MEKAKSLQLYNKRPTLISKSQQNYRAASVVIFCVAVGLLLIRILANLLSPYISGTGADALITIILQVGILLVMPLLMYKYLLKKDIKQVIKFSNVQKTQWFNYVLAIALGICALFITIGVSTFWQNILIALGYTHTSSSEVNPPYMLVVSLILTAVLPAVCEEFTMRGGFLTVMKGSLKYPAFLTIMGIAFGLFHQNITQVFYTSLFGAFAAALTVKTKSSIPAMIAHFFNNATSVYMGYAEDYGWWGGDFYRNIDIWAANNQGYLVFITFVLVCLIFAGLVGLVWYLNSTERLKKKKAIIQDSGYDVTNKRVVLIGEENKELVKDAGLDKEVYGHKLADELFKPSLRDNMFFIGAVVVTVLSTIFTFVWGFVV